jgi:putative ABC transport system permease protein
LYYASRMSVSGLRQDIRYGIRLLRRQPGFAVVAILTMALGIGASTMLFSVAYAVLLKPLPWSDPDQLVRVTETRQGRAGRVLGTISNGTFLAWRDDRSTIEDLGGWLTQTATLTGAGDPARVPIIPTTPSLFRILRVAPQLGRLFDEGEGATTQPGAVILSHRLWQERFSGRSEIVGDVLRLDDKLYTIVGVMPREFAFPDPEARAWTAWSVPSVVGQNGALVGVIFRAIARLRTGATPEQAASEATARARGAADMGLAARALFGAAGPIDVSVVPELQAITADVRPAILVLLAAGALLLMTATANVAGLQLARATIRRREMAVRAAIGAGQHRIVGQLLIENTTIGVCGGAGGLALAAALQRLLPRLVPAAFPRLDTVTLDLEALSFALGVSVLASVACGLLPAWHVRRLNLVDTLADEGVASISATRSPAARTRAIIMAGQVAITCLLLVCAALLTRSFVALVHADRGYDPVNVLTARLPLPAGYAAEQRTHLLETLTDRLRAVPGVTHAAFSSGVPFVSTGGFSAFNMPSPRDPGTEIQVQATQRLVSAEYFGAMRLRLVEGRTLSNADTTSTPPVMVVNRTFARQYLGERAVGVRIPLRGPRAGGLRFPNEQANAEIIGVVDDMRQDTIDAPPQPEIFVSLKQVQPSSLRGFDPILVVRTVSDPAGYVATLRDILHAEAPLLALDSVMTMEDRVMTSLATPRLYAVVVSSFGMFALVVAGVGLFGVLSFSVAQRTREIGLRSALGARTRDIVALVLGQVLWIVGVGVVLGFTAALAGVPLLSKFLYGVSPHDAATFVAAAIAIVSVAAAACLVPARWATNVDPLTALRIDR